MNRLVWLFALALVSLPSALPLAAQSTPTHAARLHSAAAAANETGSWRQDLSAWRAQREHELAAPDGWLTLAGMEWLKPGLNSFGAAPDNKIQVHAQAPDHMGLLTISGAASSRGIVQLLAPAGGFPSGFEIDGNPAREGPIDVSGKKPSTMTWHGLSLVALDRGGRYVLSIKDANSAARSGFRGLHWYSPDPAYRVTARWIPYKPAQVEKIPTVIGTTLDMTAPGVAEFLLNGKVFILEPVLEGGDTGHLFFILSDGTSSTSTYEGGRLLSTALPDHGLGQPGNLTLDFNRLYNPPCAYTSYATCPLPPEKNRLPVALEAGEQRYAR